MSGIFVLEVEDIKQRTLFNFHKELFSKIENPIVLVFLWTTNNEEKKKKYKKVIENYFKDLGAKEILFLGENDPKLEEKFEKANIIYLPGGDTSILLEKLNKNPKVIEKLKEFKGIIIGNSAGAMILSKRGIYLQDEKENVIGLGLVNYNIIVHFNLDLYQKLNKIDHKTIAIFENSAIVIEHDKIAGFSGRILLLNIIK